MVSPRRRSLRSDATPANDGHLASAEIALLYGSLRAGQRRPLSHNGGNRAFPLRREKWEVGTSLCSRPLVRPLPCHLRRSSLGGTTRFATSCKRPLLESRESPLSRTPLLLLQVLISKLARDQHGVPLHAWDNLFTWSCASGMAVTVRQGPASFLVLTHKLGARLRAPPRYSFTA